MLENTQYENCIIRDIRTVCLDYDNFDKDFQEYYEDYSVGKIESSRINIMNQIISIANELRLSKKKVFSLKSFNTCILFCNKLQSINDVYNVI